MSQFKAFLPDGQQQKGAPAPQHIASVYVTSCPRPRRGERARTCGMPISFIQLHNRCTERLANKLDGGLLQYPYDISLFSLALNTWTFNSFIITINSPCPIILTDLRIMLGRIYSISSIQQPRKA
jgi:hypothetical protein